jgi:translation initiation factor 1
MSKEARLVYSTELGSIRAESIDHQTTNGNDSVCRVRRETKGRGGKEATIIWDVPGGASDLKSMGKAIKQRLGTGGSVKDGQIVIQGDHVQTILNFLRERGLQAKKAGG